MGDSFNFVGIRKNELNSFIDHIKLIDSCKFNNLKLCKYPIEEQLDLLNYLDIKMFKSFENVNSFYEPFNFENNIIFNKELDSDQLNILSNKLTSNLYQNSIK